MNKLLQNYRERFDALNLRERLLALLVGIALCYALIDAGLFSEVDTRRDQISAELKDWSARNQELDKRILDINARLHGDNQNQTTEQVQLHELQQKVKQSEQAIQDLVVQFIRPEQMVEILRKVLQQEPGLKLMKVESTGAVGMFLAQDGGENLEQLQSKHKQVAKLLKHYSERAQHGIKADFGLTPDAIRGRELEEKRKQHGVPQVYKHGILLELRGNFSATLKYLRMLENLPWKFYWDAMRFEVENYPQAKVSIVINTLSLEKEWVRV